MPAKKPLRFDRLSVMSAIIGGALGALARPSVFVYFWWSAADRGMGLDWTYVVMSSALGGLIGGFFGGMLAATPVRGATLSAVLMVSYATVGAAFSIATAFGTCIVLCWVTSEWSQVGVSPITGAPYTPAGQQNLMSKYLVCMGVVGALPVVVAGLVALISRRSLEHKSGKAA